MRREPLLRFRALRKTLPGREPLLDIGELALYPSSCLLLTGRNGAGKTTLLRIVAGLETPDRAEVWYAGRTLPWREARRAYAHEVIYLHQQPYLFDCSVADNVAYGLRRAALPANEIKTRVAHALAWAELEHLADRNARELSGGERQRVALTRAWVLQPRLLLLDEPLANLDEESRERTHFLIARLKSEGTGIVLTSHEIRGVAALADAHLHLSDGRLSSRALPARARPATVETRARQPAVIGVSTSAP
jgi:tungstate transport system ATP-binding protein